MTGSCNVITLNINRIVQNAVRGSSEDPEGNYCNSYNTFHSYRNYIKEDLIDILERVYKYHIAFKTMLYETEEKGMFAASNGGYISINKLYSTIGLNGLNEAAEFLGLKVSYNQDYLEFLQLVLSTIKEQNKIHSIHDSKRPFLFNSEVVPRLSGHVKPLVINLELL